MFFTDFNAAPFGFGKKLMMISDRFFTRFIFKSFLFVPADDYFVRKSAQLSAHANEKLGGVADLYHMINDFFSAFDQARTSSFIVSIPDNFYADGSRGFALNVFSWGTSIIRVIKAILTAAVCLITAIACYHKLRKFFKE